MKEESRRRTENYKTSKIAIPTYLSIITMNVNQMT